MSVTAKSPPSVSPPHLSKPPPLQNRPQARSVKEKSKDWLARNQDNVYVWGDM